MLRLSHSTDSTRKYDFELPSITKELQQELQDLKNRSLVQITSHDERDAESYELKALQCEKMAHQPECVQHGSRLAARCRAPCLCAVVGVRSGGDVAGCDARGGGGSSGLTMHGA